MCFSFINTLKTAILDYMCLDSFLTDLRRVEEYYSIVTKINELEKQFEGADKALTKNRYA